MEQNSPERKLSVHELANQLRNKIPVAPKPPSNARRKSEPSVHMPGAKLSETQPNRSFSGRKDSYRNAVGHNSPTFKPPVPKKPDFLSLNNGLPAVLPKPKTVLQPHEDTLKASIACLVTEKDPPPTIRDSKFYVTPPDDDSDTLSSVPSEDQSSVDFGSSDFERENTIDTPRPGENDQFEFSVQTPTTPHLPLLDELGLEAIDSENKRKEHFKMLQQVIEEHMKRAGIKEKPEPKSMPNPALFISPRPMPYIPPSIGTKRNKSTRKERTKPTVRQRKPSFQSYEDENGRSESPDSAIDAAKRISDPIKSPNQLEVVTSLARPVSEPIINNSGRDSGFGDQTISSVASGDYSRDSEFMSPESRTEQDEIEETPEEKRLRRLHCAANEFMTTEFTHTESLKKLGMVFPGYCRDTEADPKGINVKLDAAQCSLLDLIEKHIGTILPVHLKLYELFQDALNTWNSEKPVLAHILVEYAQMLKVCAQFLKEKMDITNNLINAQKNDDSFRNVCRTFEMRAFRGLPITAQFDCVHQRVMRYPLLLQAYKKYLPGDSEESKITDEACRRTVEIANYLDKLLVGFNSFEELREVDRKLQGAFDVFSPGRKLIKQGMVQKQSRKDICNRYLILFSDVFLYCRQSLYDTLEIGFLFHLDEFTCFVTEVEHDDFKQNFVFQGKNRALTFIARDQRERNAWVEDIRRALDELGYRNKTLSIDDKRKILSSIIPVITKTYNGTFAPPWLPDRSVTMCQMSRCNAVFNLVRRRHHCRCCGKIICNDCSGKAPLLYTNFVAERVCVECFDLISSEMGKGKYDAELHERMLTRSRMVPSFKAPNCWSGKKCRSPSPVHSSTKTVTGYLMKFDEKKREWRQFWVTLTDNIALQFYLAPNVIVVGNPAAPHIPAKNITAMTRLDHNRASAQVAARVGVQPKDVKKVIIWGNHSATQYPDVRLVTLKLPLVVQKNVYMRQ